MRKLSLHLEDLSVESFSTTDGGAGRRHGARHGQRDRGPGHVRHLPRHLRHLRRHLSQHLSGDVRKHLRHLPRQLQPGQLPQRRRPLLSATGH